MLSTLQISIHLSSYNNIRKTVLLSIVFKWGNWGTEKLCNLSKVTELTRANKTIRLQSLHAHPPRHTASQSLLPGLSSPPPTPPPSHQMSHRRLSRQRTLLKMFSSILPTLSCFIGSDETFVTTTAIAMIISTLKTFAYKAGIFSLQSKHWCCWEAATRTHRCCFLPIENASKQNYPSTDTTGNRMWPSPPRGLIWHSQAVRRWLPSSPPQVPCPGTAFTPTRNWVQGFTLPTVYLFCVLTLMIWMDDALLLWSPALSVFA